MRPGSFRPGADTRLPVNHVSGTGQYSVTTKFLIHCRLRSFASAGVADRAKPARISDTSAIRIRMRVENAFSEPPQAPARERGRARGPTPSRSLLFPALSYRFGARTVTVFWAVPVLPAASVALTIALDATEPSRFRRRSFFADSCTATFFVCPAVSENAALPSPESLTLPAQPADSPAGQLTFTL